MRNSTSPFLRRLFASTGTSMTRPRTCGTTWTTGAYIRPSWLTGWKTDSMMYSKARITIPPKIAVQTVYVVTGTSLNFANTSQHNTP